MKLIIRKAKIEEWNELVDIYKREKLEDDVKKVRQEAPKEFQEIGEKRIIWLAEVDGLVVGAIQLVLSSSQKDLADGKKIAMVHHIRVAEDFQGKGIGSKLTKVLEKEAKKRNIHRLTLEVEKSNPKAQKIYKHWGYRCLREGKDPKEIVMFREIN